VAEDQSVCTKDGMNMDAQPLPVEPRKVLQSFSHTLRREAHVLVREPDLLWQQMYNRLQWEEGVTPLFDQEFTRRSKPRSKPWLHLRNPYNESGALVRTLEVPGKEISAWGAHDRGVTACAVSPNGRTIVSVYFNGFLRIWDVATGTERVHKQPHPGVVEGCSISPDGNWVASYGQVEGRIEIWEISS